ncbi:MAG: response regulator transcription factor [Myxococcota bacterium]
MSDAKPMILLVEDDEKLGQEVVSTLGEADFDVTWKKSGRDARWVEPDEYALVVLDLMLPGKHGFDLLKDWRETSDVPVIILTARKDTHDKIRGFKLGGDDYLTKPFWPEELVARIEARLRRPTIKRDADRTVGPISVDFDSRHVSVDGEAIELTKVEFDLVAALARRPGMALTRRQLVDRALDAEKAGTERTLDVHVSRIRSKLGDASDYLQTVWGIGYRLAESLDEE